jgi:carboxyl-terminal processing protease
MYKTPTALLLLVLSFGWFNSNAQHHNVVDQYDRLNSLLKMIDDHYVDSVNYNQLIEHAMITMLEELDPHSVYIPKEELARMNEPLIGNFEGIGVRYNILRDTITVVSPLSGGPSEKLGIKSGDKIIYVENENVAGVNIKNSDVTRLLRGKKGTKVSISILRRGEKELLGFDIIRGKIPLYSIDASYMATPEIGYIKVNRFARRTHTEFVEKLTALKKQDMQHLILDLRGNGGGYLETAQKLVDEFLDKNKLIVYTEGLKQTRYEYKAYSKGNFEKGKLVILVDEGSASASEIVAGAIQDWDRGLVIGRKSFGKGLVQKQYGLPDGSAVRLTTARYYTPSGRCIQKPYDGGKEDYYKEISHRYEHGEVYVADSIQFPDSLKFSTNRKRTVFGGGGIMPDVFIPLDTQHYSNYYRDLVRKGVFNEFILTHLDVNRDELKNTYPTFVAFQANYDVQQLLHTFIAYATQQGIEKNEDEYERSKESIALQLNALLAQNLWSSSEYYQVLNTQNNMFNKAIETIEDNTFNRSNLSYK